MHIWIKIPKPIPSFTLNAIFNYRVENLMLETVGTLNDITGHISTWSAFQNYTKERGKENGKKLLENFQKEYKLLLNDDAQDTCKVKFNYFLLLGRKK